MALRRALPVMVSYFFISMAFGVLASPYFGSLSVLMSLSVFAGAAQFIALRMVEENADIWLIILTTLLINSRHLLMSSYMSGIFRGLNPIKRAVMAFGITDETFAVGISSVKGTGDWGFQVRLNFLALSAWVSGTAFGIAFGQLIPEKIYSILPFGLTAMFIAILTSSVRGISYAVSAIVAGVIAVVIGSSTGIIFAALAGIVAGGVAERWTG
ncbi:AzlC family ABC transporter permease [Geoglobus ahangari]